MRWETNLLVSDLSAVVAGMWNGFQDTPVFFLCCWNQCGVCSVSRLHVAAARGHADCLSVLLAHSADLSLPDAAGIPTSRFCSRSTGTGPSETVSLTSPAGFHPLHLAAKNNQLECCRKLLQVPSHHPPPALPSGAATFGLFPVCPSE